MTLKTPIWAVMAGLLVILSFGALWLPGPLTTAAPLDQPRAATAPQAQPAGSGDWRSTGPYGGVARALALSPNFANDGLALAGGWKTGRLGRTGGYGIVRTTDGGATWEPVFAAPPWSQLAVMDLAISPGFDADATAYAATEAGLLRSGNRGLTWERLHGGLPEPGNDPAADDIVRVLLSPGFALDGTLLAIQASGALFLSPDRGNTWSRPPVAPLAAASLLSQLPGRWDALRRHDGWCSEPFDRSWCDVERSPATCGGTRRRHAPDRRRRAAAGDRRRRHAACPHRQRLCRRTRVAEHPRPRPPPGVGRRSHLCRRRSGALHHLDRWPPLGSLCGHTRRAGSICGGLPGLGAVSRAPGRRRSRHSRHSRRQSRAVAVAGRAASRG